MNKLKLILLACLAAGNFIPTHSVVAAAGNTVVRFQLRYGPTVFGNVDVELFNDLKPITVSNFLYYVETGAYDRSIIHRAIQGSFLQGGRYSVENPYSSTLFKSITAVPEGPKIPDEVNFGPLIHNTFGTLTMEKIQDEPNSATSSWLFNLGDNSSTLDTESGGFTVFGRVKSGAKYLSYFNTISENDGIISMVGLSWLFSSCDYPMLETNEVAFDSLPVTFFNSFDCPYYSDLFHVQISVISGQEVTAPKVAITQPAKNQVVTNDILGVTGTVTDNAGIEMLRVFLNGGSPAFATFTNNSWSIVLSNVPPGTNTIMAEATDNSGNRSLAISSFFRSFRLPVSVALAGTGTGTTTGPTNGQMLEIGRSYLIEARPDPKNLFVSWTASLNESNGSTVLGSSGNPLVYFNMETNLQLVARIDTNLFPYITGTYNGLFVNTNEPAAHHTSGFLTLKLGEGGGYSAKILLNGKTYPFSGVFNTEGDTANTLDFSVTNQLRASMKADLLLGSDQITGYLTNRSSYPVSYLEATNVIVTNLISTNIVATNIVRTTNAFLTWSAPLTADRALFNAKTNPAPQAGKYTLAFPTDTNSAAGPGGDGYGTVAVSTAGGISFSGSLADGTKVAQKTSLSKNGEWPFYVPLYKGKGSLISWVAFDTNQPDTDFSGLFNWFKQTQTAKYHPAGFTNEAMIAGSRYSAPNATNRMLDVTNAIVGFTNGNLAADFAYDVTLDAKGKVTSTNKLSLSISSGKGTFSGSTTPPGATKAVPFKGVVLQKPKSGSGYFLGTNLSGQISIQPQ